MRRLVVEYGSVGLWVYFTIFALALVGFATAIRFGVEIEGAMGAAGTWGAAYLATKVTQPLRILGTIVLTPIVVRVFRRLKPEARRAEGDRDPGARASEDRGP
jgi:hypothetical protein